MDAKLRHIDANLNGKQIHCRHAVRAYRCCGNKRKRKMAYFTTQDVGSFVYCLMVGTRKYYLVDFDKDGQWWRCRLRPDNLMVEESLLVQFVKNYAQAHAWGVVVWGKTPGTDTVRNQMTLQEAKNVARRHQGPSKERAFVVLCMSDYLNSV